MNRRQFALSWGRKIFFGISFPFSLLLTLLYLRSFIIPTNALDWLYFVTTYFGHVGLLTSLVYFLIYCPIILLMPTYYISKIWSLVLIMSFNVILFLDALSYTSYQLHLYSYISRLFLQDGILYLLGSTGGVIILSSVSLVVSALLWFRGEMLWRYMQGRFSNPVKNWYLVLIVLSLIISRSLFHTGNIHPKLAEIFPLNFSFVAVKTDHPDNRKFYYPGGDLQCVGKQNQNLVLVVLPVWRASEFTPEIMPNLWHMQKHGVVYRNLYGVSSDEASGLFSLFYSLPSGYMSSAGKTPPALFKLLQERKYEVVRFEEQQSDASSLFLDWMSRRSGDETAPFAATVRLEGPVGVADGKIQSIILRLQKDQLLQNTTVLVTGAFGAESDLVPLLWISPERKSAEIMTPASQYDIVPTLMQRMWGCKKVFKYASIGESLDNPERGWILKMTGKGFKILDLKNDNVISVEKGSISDAKSNPHHELIFSALKKLTTFNRPH